MSVCLILAYIPVSLSDGPGLYFSNHIDLNLISHMLVWASTRVGCNQVRLGCEKFSEVQNEFDGEQWLICRQRLSMGATEAVWTGTCFSVLTQPWHEWLPQLCWLFILTESNGFEVCFSNILWKQLLLSLCGVQFFHLVNHFVLWEYELSICHNQCVWIREPELWLIRLYMPIFYRLAPLVVIEDLVIRCSHLLLLSFHLAALYSRLESSTRRDYSMTQLCLFSCYLPFLSRDFCPNNSFLYPGVKMCKALYYFWMIS